LGLAQLSEQRIGTTTPPLSAAETGLFAVSRTFLDPDFSLDVFWPTVGFSGPHRDLAALRKGVGSNTLRGSTRLAESDGPTRSDTTVASAGRWLVSAAADVIKLFLSVASAE
jgi:hypothetical protein